MLKMLEKNKPVEVDPKDNKALVSWVLNKKWSVKERIEQIAYELSLDTKEPFGKCVTKVNKIIDDNVVI